MTTVHLAIDRNGLAAPDGVIAGMSDSLQGLRDAGYAATTYAGDRLGTIDTTDDTKWNVDCQVGWYWVSGAVQRSAPTTELDLLKNDIHAMLDTGDAVRREISRLVEGAGQDNAKAVQAHQWMWRARGGSYLVGQDRGLTVAQRRAWAQANRLGPTDVTGSSLTERVLNYFTHFGGVSPTSWLTFARPADAVRSTLAGAYAVDGTIADTVDLVDRAWVDAILAGTSE